MIRHRFHSICPYFAMFPETFAERWITSLTEPGDLVFDPFCGRGTAPFQALLLDRKAAAGDVNPVAYVITRAKTSAPHVAATRRRLAMLEQRFEPDSMDAQVQQLPPFFHHAYHPRTLRQVLFLRDALKWDSSDVDCMIAALMLGSLHGESLRSPAYLSNQMPRTISTKPDYSIRFWTERSLTAPQRDAFMILRSRLAYRYASSPPARRGTTALTDVRDFHRTGMVAPGEAKLAITSPPYLNLTSFEEDQWLRVWFLRGPTRPNRRRLSRDDRHYRLDDYWAMIADIWRCFGYLLADRAHVVVRLGFKHLSPSEVVDGVVGTSVVSRRKVGLQSWGVSEIGRRQTDAFRPGSRGCLHEVDVHLRVA